MSSIRIFSILSAVLFAISVSGKGAFACDLCSIYNSLESQKTAKNTLRFGVAEQFTAYNNLRLDGHFVKNEMRQHLESSITQLVGSYDFSDTISIQTSLPYINRRFKRVEGEAIETGTEAGIGDMTILGRCALYRYRDADTLFTVQILGGIEIPTGDSDRLKEELSEEHHAETMSERHAEHDHEEETPSAVHGHDLALGSGSFDYPVGVNIFAEKGRLFMRGRALYTIRTAGDHQYQYGDDLMWDFGPGYYLYLQHDSTVAARVVLSGENKSKDSGKDGEIQSDTGITSMFIGPEIDFMMNSSLSGEFGLGMPVDINTSGFQTVASYRIRTGLTYRF